MSESFAAVRAPMEDGRPLRIMLVTTSLLVGGAETQVYLLARRFTQFGHDVEVVTMRAPEYYQEELAEAGIGLTSLGFTRGNVSLSGMLKLIRRIREWRPDVLHSHMVHANLLARVSRPFAPVPVSISTAHNFTEGARWRELAYRATDHLATLSTNVCQTGAERYQRVGAAPPGRMIAMPNGIVVDDFVFSQDNRNRLREELSLENRFVWLAVGRLELQKDLPTMLHGFSRLPPGERTLLIVGDGPLNKDIVELKSELGMTHDQVRLLGRRTDIPDLMAAADAYLMSSAWEGLPLVLIEASAASLPIIATDVGGNAEVVDDGKSGFVVPPGDPEGLAAAMVRVESLTAAERRAMGAEGYERARAKYEIDGVAKRWITLYRELGADYKKRP